MKTNRERSSFGARLLEVLGARDLSQAQLARKLGSQPQWVHQLVNGTRKPTTATVHRIASALGIPSESLSTQDLSNVGTPISRLEERLMQLRHIGDAIRPVSCTLYLRDPLWRTEYRLVALSGVEFPEPLFGFLSRKNAAIGSERFVNDTLKDGRRDSGTLPQVPKDLQELFGNFCAREKVGSYARVTHPMNSETPEAILFLNYRQPRTFTESDKTRARSSLRALQPLIAPVLRQLAEEDREWLADAARIVQPASSITSNDVVGPKLDRYYRRILDSALEALGLSGITGIGMLHLYDHDRLTLTLETFTGCVEQTANTECLSVTTGTGVQSWVVRHRRALLLTDVATSKFQPIHVPLAPEVKSELAVPIEVDGDLVGVLSLQCTEPKRFKPHHVRSVWYVANRLGIVHRLHAQANLNREFLQICAETTTKALDPKAPLRHIAHLAARHFRAHSCRLWSYDPRRGQLVHSAWGDGTDSSDESRVGPRVRSRGFSADILKWQQPLWLTNINTEASFKVYRWLPAGWHPLPADRSALKTVNVSLKGDRIRCQAGLPIQFQGRCIGVAWVKFVRDHEPPGDAWMRLAQGFVSAAGLILDAVRRSTSRRLPRS